MWSLLQLDTTSTLAEELLLFLKEEESRNLLKKPLIYNSSLTDAGYKFYNQIINMHEEDPYRESLSLVFVLCLFNIISVLDLPIFLNCYLAILQHIFKSWTQFCIHRNLLKAQRFKQ